MAHYQFFLFRNGDVVGQTDCPCIDDVAALEIARTFSGAQSVEIYSKTGFVACVKHDGHPDGPNPCSE